MTSRDHMPGYAPALDDEPKRDGQRLPYPLGVPNRIREQSELRRQEFLSEVRREVGPAIDPLKASHLMQSDVPGVLVAGGAQAVVDSLERIQRAGMRTDAAAAKLRERASRDGESNIVAAIDRWERDQARNTNRDRVDKIEQAYLDREGWTDRVQTGGNYVLGVAGSQLSYGQAVSIMNAHQNHANIGGAALGYASFVPAGTEQPQTFAQTKAEMQAYIERKMRG